MEAETTLDSKSLKVLGVDTRQDILKELKDRPHTASELSRHLDKHITTIKEHLDMLIDADLVERREREGRKWVYYSLSRKGEKLFKPFTYSWVVILGLSVVCIFSGIVSFSSRMYAAAPQIPKGMGTSEAVDEIARDSAAESWTAVAGSCTIDPVSTLLVIAGLAGLIYVLYRKLR